ncbi:universal stress protein [Streptomyces malaysiensis]|uniref:Universal stress protein n=1 Tax=Streptomyces malaysiensis subsp. samsunensis TaxID=459658 RepID=A0A9X2RSJ7_STRMQ|nr:universal stress protein [Streptomyces samsunensis]MCQ8828823.1 universal stress protein [Streptomyces samsunensis]
MARPITVGLDGSPESLDAADWAAREARSRHAPLRLVHAWMPPPRTARTAQAPEAGKEWAHTVLEDAEADLAARYPDVPLSTELMAETAVPALVAQDAGSEMLVLGSRGRGAVAGFLLGSIGLHVLGRATRPVVLVRQGSGRAHGPTGGDVLVGVQDPPESAAPIEFAFATAAARGTGVRAVRAWALPPVFEYGTPYLRALDEAGGIEPGERKRLAEAVLLWREKYPEVPVTEHVEMGNAAEVLLTSAVGAGLVVLGRHSRRSAVGPRLGHVAHALLHHAACPIAVVPYD